VFGEGESYIGVDKEKWEVEGEIARREKFWEIPASFFPFVVDINSCLCFYVVVQVQLQLVF